MNSEYLPFNKLKKLASGKNTDGLPQVKVAILGDSATQFLTLGIKGALANNGYAAQIFEADVDQVTMQLLSPNSEWSLFKPDYTIIYEALPHTKKRFYKSKGQDGFFEEEVIRIEQYTAAAEALGSRLIYFNHKEEGDKVFGHYAMKHKGSIEYQLKQLNLSLMQLAVEHSNFLVFDFNAICAQQGYVNSVDRNFAVQADMQISLELLPVVCTQLATQILAGKGVVKKCLILDLDNTTWGGIIGDDGLENIKVSGAGIGKAFNEIQRWALQLKNRGIVLAVASKNTEHIAKEPFEKHPDMVLRLKDISVFMANWDNKVKNIQRIQEILNIGFDSMVFLDDNPFERGMVRENLPEVVVPELPGDPVDYMPFLRSLTLFETPNVSLADKDRTTQYQTEAKRQAERVFFEDEDAYLESLNMQAEVEPLTAFNVPRVAQLTQRSNQFNLRTERFTENELKHWDEAEGNFTFAFSLEDKYGSHGLIAIVMLEKQNNVFFIKNWIMSCRVLKRGVEKFCLNELAHFCQQQGAELLKGEYLPTPKNELVRKHYKNLGFTEAETNVWQLELETFSSLPNHIQTNHIQK